MAVGNILGSNVMNIMGIIGIASIVGGGIEVASEFAERDIWIVIATSGMIAGIFLSGKEISKLGGGLMIFVYFSYMAYLASIGMV